MKKLKWIALTLVAVVIAGAVVAYFSFNSVLRSAIESQAGKSLNLPTTLGSARLSLFGGSFSLGDLKIGSPAGFDAPEMLSLGGARVQVSYSELRKQPVRIAEVVIDRPRLVIEQKDGKFNFQSLSQTANGPSPEPKDESAGEPTRVIISSIEVKDAEVVLRPGLPGLAEEMTLSVPTFALKDIGTGEGNQNGAELRRVAGEVAAALAERATASGKLPAELGQLLTADVDQLKAKLKEEVTGRVQDVIRDAIGQPRGAGNPLNDILNRPKKPEDKPK
jgi:uncharacterized protein involved in outer membrane biogenesis